jgi:hypothetical protein
VLFVVMEFHNCINRHATPCVLFIILARVSILHAKYRYNPLKLLQLALFMNPSQLSEAPSVYYRPRESKQCPAVIIHYEVQHCKIIVSPIINTRFFSRINTIKLSFFMQNIIFAEWAIKFIRHPDLPGRVVKGD